MLQLVHRAFDRKSDPLTVKETILWWELRRGPFNLLVGAAGVVSIICGVLTALLTGSECGVPDPPLFAVIGIVLYGIAANLMYTGGWILELVLRPHMGTRKFAQVAFAAGLSLSVLFTISPSVVVPIACTLGGGQKMLMWNELPNMALNLAPSGRWTALKRRRLALR